MALKQDYSFALDKDQCLINIEDAQKGNEYFCPCCGKVMITKQGAIRKWHFAHKGSLDNCSYETYLHKVAKIRIKKCFEESPSFIITFHPKATCSIEECPLGVSNPCRWLTPKSFDLKKIYNCCQEEATIGKFRADLLLTNSDMIEREPVLIEINVSHQSTEEKINSGYRIIEVCISSEKDIDDIVSSASINEVELDIDYDMVVSKHNFYNFRADTSEKPDIKHQAHRYRFWINSRGSIKFDKFDIGDNDEETDTNKCLSPNPEEITYSIFRIESKEYIRRDFAFKKLAQSRAGLRYCTMCRFYRYNDSYNKSMCILYKSKETQKFPMISSAQKCPHFKQIDYSITNIDESQECRVYVNQALIDGQQNKS